MWESTTIGARSADVFTPEDRARFALVFFADIDGVTLRENPVWTTLFNEHRLACVCPDGGESWWSSRLCSSFDSTKSAEENFLEDVVPWVTQQFGSANIALAGVGAGGQAALRFGFKFPDRFRVVASLGGSIDHYELYSRGTALDEMYPSREHCRQDGVMLHVHPSNWPAHVWFACDPDSPWLRGNDRLHEKLMAIGVPHTFDFTTRVCGHSWTYYDSLAPTVIRYVSEGLERQSRRLM